MYYGTRSAWFDPVLAAQPQGFCRVAAGANPALKRRLAELDRLRVHVRPEHARAVEEHRLIAEVSGRGLFGRDHTGVLADLARILAEVAENRRRGRVSVPRVSRPYVPS